MVSKPRSLKRIIPMLGATVAAALALGVTAVPAFAAVPEATVRPVVSPSTPHLGVTETTTTGTWTGNPTSYSYRWLRCNAGGGECGAISGATSTTYTPVEADVGHSLKSEVKATNASGTGTAFSDPTNALTIPSFYWYSCQKGVEGPFEDAFCSKEAKGGTYSSKKLTASTGIAMNGTTSFVIKWKMSGIQFKVKCSSLKGEGTVENPAGKVGDATVPKTTLSGCKVEQPESGCKLSGGQLPILALDGEATEFEAKPAMRFTPQSGTVAEFAFQECSGALSFMNGVPLKFTGTFTGVANSATSSFEFKESTSQLNMSGQPVSFEGTSKVETAAGEALKLAP